MLLILSAVVDFKGIVTYRRRRRRRFIVVNNYHATIIGYRSVIFRSRILSYRYTHVRPYLKLYIIVLYLAILGSLV